jgi:hypothetical protein
VKIRAALRWLNEVLRPVQLPREGAMFGGRPVSYPPNYVPSQQDERPH